MSDIKFPFIQYPIAFLHWLALLPYFTDEWFVQSHKLIMAELGFGVWSVWL